MLSGRRRVFIVAAALTVTLAAGSVTDTLAKKRKPISKINDAVSRLVTCKNLRANVCTIATATLTNAGDKALSLVLKYLRTMTKHGQILAMSIFENNSGRKSTRSLIKICRDKKLAAFMRAMSIRTLGEREGRGVLSTLLKKAGDKDPLLRAAAVRAIGNRAHGNHKKVIAVLVKTATDINATVRLEAVMGLGLSVHAKGGPVLTKALGDSDPRVRLAATQGLRHVKYDPSVLPLIEKLRDKDISLRSRAADALTYQTGKDLGEDYSLWRAWYDNR